MSSDKRTKDMVRKVEKETRSAKRDLARDQRELEREEKTLEAEIKRQARLGDRAACTRLAKQLVAVRKQLGRNAQMSSKMTQLNSQQRLNASQLRMVNTMDVTTKTFKQMNKQMDPKKVAQNMQDFQKVQLELGMKEELMDDMMNDLDPTAEDEEDEVINQVLSSLAVDVGVALDKARVPTSSLATDKESVDLSDLEAQLEKLRN